MSTHTTPETPAPIRTNHKYTLEDGAIFLTNPNGVANVFEPIICDEFTNDEEAAELVHRANCYESILQACQKAHDALANRHKLQGTLMGHEWDAVNALNEVIAAATKGAL